MIRVLHAEDDPQIAELVRFNFDRHGIAHAITRVDCGRRCLEEMQRGEFDLLLLDLMMPDLDGLQVLGELMARRDPTPVIMVSGQGQHALAVRALRAGAVDCIDKNSADFRRLPEIVQQAIARHRRQTQHRTAAASATLPGVHRILYLDADTTERSTATAFFSANAPRLQLTTAVPSTLEKFLRGEASFEALVLGPHYDTVSMLNALRQLRACEYAVPVVVLATRSEGDTAIAAFKLGAVDYLIHRPGVFSELVFTLNNVLKQADTERLNQKLTEELATLNRSLSDQVAARTRELEAEVVVRRDAEKRAFEQAARSQALSTRLLRAQEDERRAVALELHDQVGQTLTGLRFQLENAKAEGADLAEALTLTDELLRSIREMTLELRPRILDDFGLQPALEWHAGRFTKQTGIRVELDFSLPMRLTPELETAAYRLVQESLTNVARHSGARAAVVTIAAGDEALHVEVADQGNGFDVSAALARRDSLGLAGLAERVKFAGGLLDIFSQPGQGTRLHAEFPFARPAVPSP